MSEYYDEDFYGYPLDSFDGVTEDDRVSAALSYAASQTYAPTIIFPRRRVDVGNSYNLFNGMRIAGSLGAGNREFTTPRTQSQVFSSGSSLFRVPASGVSDVWIKGIEFRAGATGVNWLDPVADLSNGPLMSDVTIRDVGWYGYASVMQARHLRVKIASTYCNGGTDTQFKLGGSDNSYWCDGESYLSGSVPASQFYLWFTHMSRTRVGAIYITPQLATAIRIDGTYGDLQFHGTLFDDTGRNLSNGCQGSALYITGGEGYVFDHCWFFNNALNPAATGRTNEKGQVNIKAGKEMLFDGCSFGGFSKQTGYTPAGTPQIYAASGVTDIRVENPLAPNGGIKLLESAAAGAIICNNTSWTIQVP